MIRPLKCVWKNCQCKGWPSAHTRDGLWRTKRCANNSHKFTIYVIINGVAGGIKFGVVTRFRRAASFKVFFFFLPISKCHSCQQHCMKKHGGNGGLKKKKNKTHTYTHEKNELTWFFVLRPCARVLEEKVTWTEQANSYPRKDNVELFIPNLVKLT